MPELVVATPGRALSHSRIAEETFVEFGVERLRALCEAVLRAPAERSTLAQWASSVGASERTLARLFRDQLGMSYPQWRQQAVLASAIPMMSQGMPLSRVAQCILNFDQRG